MFRTADVDLAAFLCCRGLRYAACLKADPVEGKPPLAEFIFDHPHIPSLAADYYANERVEALTFARKRRRLFHLARRIAEATESV